MLDGEVLAELTADDTGQFATVLDLPSASEPQQLILRTLIDGEVAQSTSVQAEPDPIAVAKAEEARKAAEQAAAEEAAAKAAAEEATRAAAVAQRAAEQAAAEAAAKAAADEAERLAAEEAARKAEEEAARLAAEESERKAAEEAARLAAEKAEAERIAAEAAADPAAGSTEPNVVASAPVFILPRPETGAAPVLVKPGAEDISLLQPAQAEPAANITLDRLTYSDAGALVAAGRGRPGSVVRVYANAEFLDQVVCNAAGEWQIAIETDVASSTQLLRFDSIDADGNVIGRLETPFEYSPESVAQEVKQREIVVQRGDYLWKFAEQHYGEGWRYSVIFSANSNLIRDPDLIYPGQIFKVPELVQTQ
ncbi:MAG: LysM peptidoglycan-binding domain-containing protein [Paracoccaceae bacterium]|nr:LysM peptidoglycan-binding domain-containing protein [Paracoccaceae bacterium]